MYKVMKGFSTDEKTYEVNEEIQEKVVTERMKELGLVRYIPEEKPKKKKKEVKKEEVKEVKKEEVKEELLTEISSDVDIETSEEE